MIIEKRTKEKATILLFRGDLIYDGLNELEKLFSVLSDSVNFVILDLGNTQYISAKALGIIAFYARIFQEKRGGLKLANMSENIKRIFDITGLLKVVEIFESQEAALANIGPQVGKLEKMLLYSKKNLA
jgi:anti-anti-sigma factor